jgi:hypothetical protein
VTNKYNIFKSDYFYKNERDNKQSIYLKRDNKHANKQSIKGRNGVIAKTTWGAIYRGYTL